MRTCVTAFLLLSALLLNSSLPNYNLDEEKDLNYVGDIGGNGGVGKSTVYPPVLEDTLPSSISITDLAWSDESSFIAVGYFSENLTMGNQTFSVNSGSEDLIILNVSLQSGIQWAVVADCEGDDRITSVEISDNGGIWVIGQFSGELTIDNTTFAPSAVKTENRLLVAHFSPNGQLLGGIDSDAATYVIPHDIELSGSGAYIVGEADTSLVLGTYDLTGIISDKVGFIAHVSMTGVWDSLRSTDCCTGSIGSNEWDASFTSISSDSDGNLLITGHADEGITFENTEIVSGRSASDSDGFVMRIDSAYNVIWVNSVGSEESLGPTDEPEILTSLSVSGDFVHVVGTIKGTQQNKVSAGQISVQTRSGYDAFVGILDLQNGTWLQARGIGGINDDIGGKVVELSENITVISIGYHSNINLAGSLFTNAQESGVLLLAIDSQRAKELWAVEASAFSLSSYPGGLAVNQTGAIVTGNLLDSSAYSLLVFENDEDGDGYSIRTDAFPLDDSQYRDSDGDGLGDSSEGNNPDDCPSQWGNSTLDRNGCPDTDGDGVSNMFDKLPDDSSQWLDFDDDGFGDNRTGNMPDSCPAEYGESDADVFGCPDSDEDGWSDLGDAFANDASQWRDTDNDGFGDNLLGFEGDSCPTQYGGSSADRFGCPDMDSDLWSDENDAFIDEPLKWSDVDGDGYADNPGAPEIDLWPNDATQWSDSDSDGHGDNQYGTLGDHFPEDSTQWSDMDGDGYGDDLNGNNPDAFSYNPTQWLDSDGDGWGDNQSGLQADRFPSEPTQWSDIDGDGCGDNPLGVNPDSFPYDFTQCTDRDGDGYGDNINGNRPDIFPDEPSQWIDEDGDGLGDNSSGINGDQYLDDFDNDGYKDSEDILPKFASPGDRDADGCMDEDDLFENNSNECSDFDGDGIGDNEDTDDDGDGWSDSEEMRLGTNYLSSKEKPVDSFEVVIPGTEIGLGAWDLLGILLGLPMATWLSFGILTRKARGERFAELLRNCQNLIALEDASKQYETALKYKLLGPHQGLMLERVRSNVENDLQESELGLAPDSSSDYTGPSRDIQGNIDADGWEWLEHGGTNWYRDQGDGRWRPWKE